MHFGVREHAMGAIVNGLVLSHLRAFGATFLIFSDYMRPPIRLAALMELPVFHVFTHDSIGVGEDGPTHQPVEQLVSLRAIPGMIVLRPADANEVREAYRVICTLRDRPACLALSRQALPIFDRSRYAAADGLARGAYVIADAAQRDPQVILIGTGSEVQLCIKAYERLTSEGFAVSGAVLINPPDLSRSVNYGRVIRSPYSRESLSSPNRGMLPDVTEGGVDHRIHRLQRFGCTTRASPRSPCR